MKKALLALSFFFLTGVAHAQTVDFTTYSQLDSKLSAVSDGGLTFTSGSGGYMAVWDGNAWNSGGNPGLIYAYGPPMTVTLTAGGPFNLDSLDATLSFYNSDPSDTMSLVGYLQGGGTVSQDLTLVQGLQNDDLVGFSDVTSVSIGDVPNYWLISSVTYSTSSTIPEGGASLLYLLLAGVSCGTAVFVTRGRRLANRS